MKDLFLIRHAKSSWKDSTLDDFDRPLNKRGKRDAPFMADHFKSLNLRPQLLLSSPALRARKTAEAFADALDLQGDELGYVTDLYEASANVLLRQIQQTPDRIERLALCGHNPGLNELATQLLAQAPENIPTAGILAIRLPIERWLAAGQSTGEMLFYIYPKRLQQD